MPRLARRVPLCLQSIDEREQRFRSVRIPLWTHFASIRRERADDRGIWGESLRNPLGADSADSKTRRRPEMLPEEWSPAGSMTLAADPDGESRPVYSKIPYCEKIHRIGADAPIPEGPRSRAWRLCSCWFR